MKKRVLSLLMILCTMVCVCGCGSEKQSVPEKTETVPAATTEDSVVTPETEANRVPEGYPVVVLDNEYVRITVEGKYSEEGRNTNFGYHILIENKCDKYIMVLPSTCSMDGFMLSSNESPQVLIHTVAPYMKAKTVLAYTRDTSNNDIVRTVDDLVNLDGLWQISFSEDGNGFRDHIKFRFDYILP